MRVLITRPGPDNHRTQTALRERGHEGVSSPLLRVEPVAEADLGDLSYAGVLITSANAARAIAVHPRTPELRRLPMLAIGVPSKEAALAAGFVRVETADDDAHALADLAAARFGGAGPLLYLAGEDRAADLEGLLAARACPVRTVAIYRAVQETTFAPDIRRALQAGTLDAAFHYSRRTAQAFVAAGAASGCGRAALDLRHFCLSEQIAAVLIAAGAAQVSVAAKPREEDLLGLLGPPR